MTSVAPSPVAQGRPRSEAVDEAILTAAVACLAKGGYEALTFSAVAEYAGVGRPAIYRRYESRAELAAAALLRLSDEHEVVLPDDGRAAIRALLGATAASLAAPGAMTILGSMLARERRDPVLTSTFRRIVFEPRHAVVRTVIHHAVVRHEVRPDVDVDIVIDLLFGSLLARALSGHDIDAAYLDRVVRVAWAAMVPPVAAPSGEASPGGEASPSGDA